MDTRFEHIVSEIERAVSRYPENIAIIENGGLTMTYSRLWEQASRLAEGLLRRKSASDHVIIELPKSARYIVSVLGCWMSGKAFVPIGPDLPYSRKEYIKDVVETDTLITPSTYPELLDHSPLERVVPLRPSTPAYIIFSSGTTGLPKGIVVGHSGLTNLARCQREAFGLSSSSRNLFYLSINFDASVSDILVTLTSGAALVIPQKNSIELSANLPNELRRLQITHADLPPSLLRVMDANECPDCLETIVIGGEATDKETVKKWADKVRLINVYGPTEATVCTSLCQYTAHWDMPLIGKELNGVRYHIHDNGNFGAEEGELWISGPCLAIGYYNNPELTAEKFPIVNGIRYYRTSDHVRRLSNGDIAFLGRFDRQVKYHGQLVELEEVEASLRMLRFVRDAAVVKRKVSADNDKEQLVAFVETDHESNIDELTGLISKHLRMHLPAWMIPGHIEFLERLPRVTSGKIDFNALADLQLTHINLAEKENYSSKEEEAVARIMAEILKIPYINPHDSFMELGGDSLDTLLLIARLRSELGITITLDQLKKDASPFAISRMSTTVMSMAIESRDLEKEWQYQAKSSPSYTGLSQAITLVTGATGFLGSHILAELLSRKAYHDKEIACLIRCGSAEHGRERLKLTFQQYGLRCDGLYRLIIVPSDLSEVKMGIDDDTYKFLAENVGELFHCAATVNMMADYDTLKASNVVGTKHVLDFCLTGCKKKLNYASTLSVFVSTTRNKGIALESDKLEEPCTIFGGYGQTKYVCEKLLLGIPSSECDINIIRYGLLCGDTVTGISARKDFLGMFMKGAALVGALPHDDTDEMGIDITPIDTATKITLDISTHSKGGIFHVAAENPLKYNILCGILAESKGITIVRDFHTWQESLRAYKHNPDVVALEMSLCRMDPESFKSMRYMDLFQTTNIRFDMENTHSFSKHRIYQNEQLIRKFICHETL